MGSKAKQIVTDSRREIVQGLIDMMESGKLDWSRGWSIAALLPQNPVSGVTYNGGNRFRLMYDAMMNGYDDPRYMTYVQAQQKGWQVKRGAKGRLCEKWIFEKMEEQENKETGRKEKVVVLLAHPMVSYFYVYHASDIDGIVPYVSPNKDHSLNDMIDLLIRASPCQVKEMMQGKAYYSPSDDTIVMPPRAFFDTDADFIKTLAHEEGHSTGAQWRLNRQIKNSFGTEDYAREELVAELCSLFLTADLGLPTDGKVAENTAAYLQSWIRALKKDPDVLFTASSDAEKAAGMIKKNFEREMKLKEKVGPDQANSKELSDQTEAVEETDDNVPIASYRVL